MNTVALLGRLTADPELKQTPNGIPVLSFTIAVNRSYKKQGEQQADFIDIVAWRQTAEFISKYFKKGQLIAVKGSIQTRTYQDKEGNNRKAFEILSDSVYFADSKGNANEKNPKTPPYNNKGTKDVSYSDGQDDFVVIGDDEDLPF